LAMVLIAGFSVGWATRLLTQQEMLEIQGGHFNYQAPVAIASASPMIVPLGDTVS